jgi:protein gp37
MAFNKTDIDWPRLTHTWNPITGCKRGCPYCYAKRNWKRLHEKRTGRRFDEITYWPSRINKAPPKKADRIFVGSMSEPEYWPTKEYESIVEYCRAFMRCEYMFLSKSFIQSYYFHVLYWPTNTMQGLTIEQAKTVDRLREFACRVRRPYLSIEPLLGPVAVDVPDEIELVIVGAMTGPGAVKPKAEWIQSCRDHIAPEKLWFKQSIREQDK